MKKERKKKKGFLGKHLFFLVRKDQGGGKGRGETIKKKKKGTAK